MTQGGHIGEMKCESRTVRGKDAKTMEEQENPHCGKS